MKLKYRRGREGKIMNEYVITTDNNADLPESYYMEHGVGCTYLSYSMDGNHYSHENFLPVEEFYAKMRSGSLPTTAQVNPNDVKELFEPYLKEGKDILHIAFSSGLSGTYNSCRIAAEDLAEEYPDRRIVVVDSLAASLGQGLLVYLAQKMKEEGADFETTAKWTEDHKKNIAHLFTVDDLNHLYRGGRVSKTTAVLGGMLNIKPVLHVDREGEISVLTKVIGAKKAMSFVASEFASKYRPTDGAPVYIVGADCDDLVEQLKERIAEIAPAAEIVTQPVGPVIGAHCGPGTYGIIYTADER